MDLAGRQGVGSASSASSVVCDLRLLAPSGAWECEECKRRCFPIREESRCLCGHRLKAHVEARREGLAKEGSFRCTSPQCRCQSFLYIVAEGAWILR